jgi:creatinine amidohydrolase/Fe(II)-dependent formamide hydrolase-like protein
MNSIDVAVRAALAVLLWIVGSCPTYAQVLHVADLTAEEIRLLDRERTVVILPAGILEQHGPHLPSYSDGFQNEHTAEALSRAIAQRPGWRALVFPSIPLGVGGANELGGKYTWPGTYAIRSSTLRAIFMDLATELGEQGFRWVFVVHGHGAPLHNRVLDEAGDYFREMYKGRMVHLLGLEADMSAHESEHRRHIPFEARKEDGDSVHAGLVETSVMIYLRPGLVAPGYRDLPSLTPVSLDRLSEISRAATWPGYFGAPRLATAETGRFLVEAKTQEYVRLAMRILDGLDERTVARYADRVLALPPIRADVNRTLDREQAEEARQRGWLEKRPMR